VAAAFGVAGLFVVGSGIGIVAATIIALAVRPSATRGSAVPSPST
jgi:hypothetical protein